MAADPPANAPADPQAAKARLAKIAADLEARYAKLEKSTRAVPRDRFDVQGVIETVGRDPQKLFAWVRENTSLLPYRGALRGTVGVLLDRGGNSLDRSLLLAALLQSVGYEARLANAQLTADQAGQLLTNIASAPQPGLPTTTAAPDPKVEEARGRARAATEQLLKLLQVSAAEAGGHKAMADALADHWWVQFHEGSRWTDLDPTGLAIPTAARTVPYALKGSKLPLEPKDCHEVEFRVVIESFSGSSLQAQPILRQTLRPAELIGHEINFLHYALTPMKEDDRKTDPESRKRYNDALIEQEGFLPVLRLDGRSIASASFDIYGRINSNPHLDAPAKVGGAAGSKAGGLAGGLLGGGGGSSTPTSVLTAEWIEYVIHVPGQPPRNLRREVFDLIGPAARAAGVKKAPEFSDADKFRRALMLQSQVQIQLQPCELSPEFIAYHLARTNLQDKNVWLGLARNNDNLAAQLDKAMNALSFRDDTTPALALIRRELGVAAGRTFIDQPNIVHSRMWREEAPDGALVARQGIDLGFTSTAAVGQDAFKSRVARGVADTLAEYLVFGDASSPTENTVPIFEQAAKSSAAPKLIQPKDDGALSQLGLPPDVLARAKADLAAGNMLVIAPASQGRWTWWRVDALSGQTVGVMDNGYCGNATIERLEAEVEEFGARFGRPFTLKQLRTATYQQMLHWGHGGMMPFIDLWEIQGELEIALNMMGRIIG